MGHRLEVRIDTVRLRHTRLESMLFISSSGPNHEGENRGEKMLWGAHQVLLILRR